MQTASSYAAGPVTKPPDWHSLVVVDALLNGLTTGLFLVAAVGELALPELLAPLARWAYLAALVFLLADLLCLLLDLGDPWRFHHMLRVFKPCSPMSLGVWALTIYFFPALAAAVLSLIGGPADSLGWARRIVAAVGLMPAFISAAYKGVLFSTTSQPGWREARWLGGYFTSSAVLVGEAAMLLLAVLLKQETAMAILRPTLVLLLLLSLIPLGLMLAELRSALARRYSPRQRTAAVALLVGGGVLSLALLLLGGDAAALVAAALVLMGSAGIRWGIVYLPQGHSSGRSKH
jgi:Ni/Fe-hydrogenase subunit HybB-like protein